MRALCLFHQPSSILLAARICARGLFHVTPAKCEGDGAPSGAAIPYGHAAFRLRGASRRAVSASLRRPVRAHRVRGCFSRRLSGKPDTRSPAAASSSRSGRSTRGSESGAARVRGLLAAPAGAGPNPTSRRNRFASLGGAGAGRIRPDSGAGISSHENVIIILGRCGLREAMV